MSMITYLMHFLFILPSFCLKVVKHLFMAAAVIYHVRPTVKKTHVIYSMEHVLHANLDGLRCIAIQVNLIK